MVKLKKLEYLSLLLYLIGISAFQLGTGFDAVFVRLSFALLVAVCVLPNMKIQNTLHFRWCIVFWGLYFLSMIWASNANDTLYYINNCIQIVGLAVCLPLIVEDDHDVDVVMNLIIVSMIITSIRLIVYTPVSMWGTERIGEAIGQNSNGLGMRLAISAVICLYMIHKNVEVSKNLKSKIKSLFYLIVMIAFFVIVLFTGSKKSILMIVGGIASYELIITKGWKFLIKVITVICGIIVLSYLIFHNEMLYAVLGKRIARTLLTLQGTATGLAVDQSLQERIFYINKAQELFLNYPILGYGGNNFVTLMREIGYSHVAYCHNNFYELLCTLGIVGFLIYYFMWAYVGSRLFKIYRKMKKRRCLLFFIVITIELIMDYGNVSYITEFTQIILIMGYLIVKIDKKIF